MYEYKIDTSKYKNQLLTIILELAVPINATDIGFYRVVKKCPKEDGTLFSKSNILEAYTLFKKNKDIILSKNQEKILLDLVRSKKTRTISGVTPVTVLTKPYPCPGHCIYCPNDVWMPKSYLSNEPGAQRAYTNRFDPYLQTYNRLVAFKNTGHPTDKVELIIIGGTWNCYPKKYQLWFIKRCFDALNDFDPTSVVDVIPPPTEFPFDGAILNTSNQGSGNLTYNQIVSTAITKNIGESATWATLMDSHKKNEIACTRCVGLSIETRPDEITLERVVELRKLGVTKVQLGVQSLDDTILTKNKRGHSVGRIANAFLLLRKAGFKIHIHWMPNLYGATPEKDIVDYKKIFNDLRFRPDEIKIYPCSLIAGTELMNLYKEGKWSPYTEDMLLYVLSQSMLITPGYCRVTRVIRDIPAADIVDGNKKANFRQKVETLLQMRGEKLYDIRSREVGVQKVSTKDLSMKFSEYSTKVSTELFIEYVTKNDKIVGFLRLSLPTCESILDELQNSAIIREVHVYGKSVDLGNTEVGRAQHLGLGKKLIHRACTLAREAGFHKVAVISSVGTRQYYARLGFVQGALYQIKYL